MEATTFNWVNLAIGSGAFLMGSGATFYIKAKIAELAASKSDIADLQIVMTRNVADLYKALDSLHVVVNKSIERTAQELTTLFAAQIAQFELNFNRELNSRFVLEKVMRSELERRDDERSRMREWVKSIETDLRQLEKRN